MLWRPYSAGPVFAQDEEEEWKKELEGEEPFGIEEEQGNEDEEEELEVENG